MSSHYNDMIVALYQCNYIYIFRHDTMRHRRSFSRNSSIPIWLVMLLCFAPPWHWQEDLVAKIIHTNIFWILDADVQWVNTSHPHASQLLSQLCESKFYLIMWDQTFGCVRTSARWHFNFTQQTPADFGGAGWTKPLIAMKQWDNRRMVIIFPMKSIEINFKIWEPNLEFDRCSIDMTLELHTQKCPATHW